MTDLDQRLEREKSHGKFLADEGAEEVWNWSSPAGSRRANRRAGFFYDELGQGLKALELGCGTGLFTRLVAGSGAQIVATDLSEILLETAKKQTTADNVTYEIADAHHLPYADGTFDVVFGSSVLHHLEPRAAFGEIFRVLKTGGVMVFAEPNMINPQIWAERNIGWVRRKTGTSPDETAFVRFFLARTLKDTGYQSVEIVPHEFLHPSTPPVLLDAMVKLTKSLERIPVLKEIAGSLLIKGRKP